VVVPVLIKALQDPNAGVRSAALNSLYDLGTSAVAAVPALLELQKDPFKNVSRGEYYSLHPGGSLLGPNPPLQIESLLKRIDPAGATRAGIK
jgi:HEAT repeat protein